MRMVLSHTNHASVIQNQPSSSSVSDIVFYHVLGKQWLFFKLSGHTEVKGVVGGPTWASDFNISG